MSKLFRAGIWALITVLAVAAFARIALSRGETISAAWLLTAAVCSYAVAYRFYSKIISSKIFALDATRATPAVRLDD
ncbi:MAG: carbon starvation CstA family protein, partial [Gemmatimonadaceae bacterium]